MSASEYARRHGLNVNTFSWWRSELGREGSHREEAPLTLVPVKTPTATERAATAAIEVALPRGVVVRVPDHAAPARVAEIVRALVSSW